MNIFKYVLAALGTVLLASSVFAASALVLTSNEDFQTVQAGGKAEFFAQLKNRSSTPLKYGTYISYKESFTDSYLQYRITPSTGTLAPGDTTSFKVSVDVPANAKNGVYVLDFYVTNQAYEPSMQRFQVEVAGGVGPSFVATPEPVQPDPKPAAQQEQPGTGGAEAGARSENPASSPTAFATLSTFTPTGNGKYVSWIVLGMLGGFLLVTFVSALVRRYEHERQRKELEYAQGVAQY